MALRLIFKAIISIIITITIIRCYNNNNPYFRAVGNALLDALPRSEVCRSRQPPPRTMWRICLNLATFQRARFYHPYVLIIQARRNNQLSVLLGKVEWTTTSGAFAFGSEAHYSTNRISNGRGKILIGGLHRGLHRTKFERTSYTGQRSRNTGIFASAVVVSMVGLTYASVPLYRMFCQVTGFGGTTQRVQAEGKIDDELDSANSLSGRLLDAQERGKDSDRVFTVRFHGDVNEKLPWTFVPTQSSVRVKAGKSALAFYTTTNKGDEALSGISTYNVTPMEAGQYFMKIQCFCFEEQRIGPKESIDMPIFFYLDPAILQDKRLRNVSELTLSYTFFKSNHQGSVTDEEMLAEGYVKIIGPHGESSWIPKEAGLTPR